MQGPPRDADVTVRTWPVRVRVYVRNGATIDGFAHINAGAGAYRRRISDVLNVGQLRYLAITDASYSLPGNDSVASACVLVNTDDISMVDASPLTDAEAEEQDRRERGEAQQ